MLTGVLCLWLVTWRVAEQVEKLGREATLFEFKSGRTHCFLQCYRLTPSLTCKLLLCTHTSVAIRCERCYQLERPDSNESATLHVANNLSDINHTRCTLLTACILSPLCFARCVLCLSPLLVIVLLSFPSSLACWRVRYPSICRHCYVL